MKVVYVWVTLLHLVSCCEKHEGCDNEVADFASMQLLQNKMTRSSTRSSVQQRKDRTRDRLQSCVNSYADALDDIGQDLGRIMREHPLSVVNTSNRNIVLAPGSGTTGTESCAAALSTLGLKTIHCGYAAFGVEVSPEYTEWKQGIWGNFREENESSCVAGMRQFDFANLKDESVDAVVDTPMAESFIDLFLAFPNAKFVLTLRPSMEWAEHRLYEFFGGTPLPMQEPCGMNMGDPRVGGNDTVPHAKLFDLNNEFIRCVVPQERLFEIDVFSEPTDNVMLELSKFLGLPPMDAEYPHCIGGNKEATASISELVASPYCPLNDGAKKRVASAVGDAMGNNLTSVSG